MRRLIRVPMQAAADPAEDFGAIRLPLSSVDALPLSPADVVPLSPVDVVALSLAGP